MCGALHISYSRGSIQIYLATGPSARLRTVSNWVRERGLERVYLCVYVCYRPFDCVCVCVCVCVCEGWGGREGRKEKKNPCIFVISDCLPFSQQTDFYISFSRKTLVLQRQPSRVCVCVCGSLTVSVISLPCYFNKT